MWGDIEVAVNKVTESKLKEKPDQSRLQFGNIFTDHMFLMKWNSEEGWHDAEICPYQNFNLDPAAMVFHYGQAIFEGMKAYKGKDDQVFLFRAEDNLKRMNKSALRMCMPRMSEEFVLKALKALIYLEKEWIPTAKGSALYIRPTLIAVEPMLGVRPAKEYYFFIILSPVGAYYKEGFNPTRIFVSDTHVRAAKGGVGDVKTCGNYAASLYASEEASKAGYTQVLWLDAVERKYVEEVGTSNIFFKINNQLVTPALGGSILPGITRDSVIKLAEKWGVEVVERTISIDEVIDCVNDGSLQEMFATGTAAVISPVGEFRYQDKDYVVNAGKTGDLSQKLFDEIQAIQFGESEDPFKWITRVG